MVFILLGKGTLERFKNGEPISESCVLEYSKECLDVFEKGFRYGLKIAGEKNSYDLKAEFEKYFSDSYTYTNIIINENIGGIVKRISIVSFACDDENGWWGRFYFPGVELGLKNEVYQVVSKYEFETSLSIIVPDNEIETTLSDKNKKAEKLNEYLEFELERLKETQKNIERIKQNIDHVKSEIDKIHEKTLPSYVMGLSAEQWEWLLDAENVNSNPEKERFLAKLVKPYEFVKTGFYNSDTKQFVTEIDFSLVENLEDVKNFIMLILPHIKKSKRDDVKNMKQIFVTGFKTKEDDFSNYTLHINEEENTFTCVSDASTFTYSAKSLESLINHMNDSRYTEGKTFKR